MFKWLSWQPVQSHITDGKVSYFYREKESLIGSGLHAWHTGNSRSKQCTYNEGRILAPDGYNLRFMSLFKGHKASCWNHLARSGSRGLLYPPHNEVVGGVYWFHSVRPSVRPSVRLSVRPSRMPCPLCNIYSYEWILFMLGTNDHYHERVCHTSWPLTLTYIFKVIWPWLRKSCPLCSVYSSGWILFMFGANDHYH